MTLKFATFVSLLEELEAAQICRATTEGRATNPDHRIIREWFTTHAHDLARSGPSALATLSCFLPERLPQRVYDLRETRLTKIFGRALGLGGTRLRRLWAWQDQTGRAQDFAEHVATIMAEAETSTDSQLTLDDIDAVLVQVAANSKFSGPKVKALRREALDAHRLLAPIIRSLPSWEAKWLIRLILKDFRTLQIPESVLLAQFHFLLPDILRTQADLQAAITMLGHEKLRSWPSNPDVGSAKALKVVAASLFEPQMGVMLARQAYDKARSIKHCISLSNKQTMSVERKYDGEYCQIHVTRTLARDHIQIFAKSGKDSTDDRMVLHNAIKSGLKLDGDYCKIQYRSILEGELLIWNSSKQNIEPFHKIRRYVMHGGRYLGVDKDSPRKADERVMIMFYDILLLDDEVLACRPHEDRRKYLKDVVAIIPGLSEIGWRKLIDFNKPGHGASRLREAFVTSIQQDWEGLVLKAQKDAYYSWSKPCKGIKLKKDYLQQLGDTADLCVVGARRDPRLSSCEGWNTFHLACLDNNETVRRFRATPSFRIVGTITTGTQCIPPADLADLNRLGQGRKMAYDGQSKFKVEVMAPSPPPAVLFDPPFVVECLGSGYHKNSNCSFWMLRFPRITKVHHDRSFTDTMTFTELQEVAQKPSHAEPDDGEVQSLIERLIAADGNRPAPTNSTQSTSPGKTPQSVTTASISPVAQRRHPPSPLLVRSAPSESGATQFRRPRQSPQTTASTTTPSSSASKHCADDLLLQSHVRLTCAVYGASTAKDDTVLQQGAPVSILSHLLRSQLESPPPSSPTPMIRAKRQATDVIDEGRNHQIRKTPFSLVQSRPAPRVEIDLTCSSRPASPDPAPESPVRRKSSNKSRSDRRARGLIRTPPWCRVLAPLPVASPNAQPLPCSEQVLTTAQRPQSLNIDGSFDSPPKRPFKVSRTPLSELPPSSPQQGRSSAKSAELVTETEATRKDTGVELTRSLPKSDLMKHQRHPPPVPEDSKVCIPTPPATEEAARCCAATKDLASETRSPRQRSEDVFPISPAVAKVASKVAPSINADVQPPRADHVSLHTALVLLSRSLPTKPRLQTLLSTSTATFTYSRSAFLRVALGRPQDKHIVLVDTANHAATAQEVWELGSRAVKGLKGIAERDGGRYSSIEPMRKTRLVFCDWRALGCLTAAELSQQHQIGDPEAKDWNRYFCCAIELGGDVVDEKGNAAGWVVWRERCSRPGAMLASGGRKAVWS